MAWLPLQDFAEVKQCSTRTVRRQVKQGLITSKLANGRRMIWVSEEVHTVASSPPSVSPEQYMVPLFEVYGGLSVLRMRFEGPLQMGDWLEHCGISQGNAAAMYESCAFFFQHLDQCFRQIDQLITDNRLDPQVIKSLYRILVNLRSHWQEAGLYLKEERGDQGVFKTPKTLNLFDHLIAQAQNLILLGIKNADAETVSQVMSYQNSLMAAEPQSLSERPQEPKGIPQTEKVIVDITEKEEALDASKDKKPQKP